LTIEMGAEAGIVAPMPPWPLAMVPEKPSMADIFTQPVKCLM
jgi:hypothetical protein